MNDVILNNGVKIPQLGIGGFAQGTDEIIKALQMGYRLIDTAAQYGNEIQVGKGIRESGVPREEVFLTTKLWTDDIRKGRTREAFFESLNRLETDYVDLYLIHWPSEGYVDAWLEMEKLYKEGYIRAIGVSNCHQTHLKQIAEAADIVPAVDQIESHPFFRNQQLIDDCRESGIQVEAWCPLGGAYGQVLENQEICEIAKKYGRTEAQIVLRWHMQRGVVTFPKSSRKKRMESNLDVFSFTLTDEEMDRINSLDTGQRMGADPDNFDF